MKVSQLIDVLQRLPADAEVYIHTDWFRHLPLEPAAMIINRAESDVREVVLTHAPLTMFEFLKMLDHQPKMTEVTEIDHDG